jgi:adenylylsulfate kinase
MPRDDDIHPEFHRMLGREAKEHLLGQRGRVFWLYGLSGSGKSTLAHALERRLHGEGVLTRLLDGDNIRTGLSRGLGFSDEDRLENIRRISEVAKLFAETGIITLAAFITPTRELRAMARDIVGAQDFREIYVKASFAACAGRDVKGLYAQAKAGGVQDFTGRDSLFEEPDANDGDVIVVDTEHTTVEDTTDTLYRIVRPLIESRGSRPGEK